MRLLISAAFLFTSLCVLTDTAAASRASWGRDPAEARTYLSEYNSLGERLRNFSERFRNALREFFSDLNIGNLGEKLRRFNEQMREAFRDLFFS